MSDAPRKFAFGAREMPDIETRLRQREAQLEARGDLGTASDLGEAADAIADLRFAMRNLLHAIARARAEDRFDDGSPIPGDDFPGWYIEVEERARRLLPKETPRE